MGRFGGGMASCQGRDRGRHRDRRFLRVGSRSCPSDVLGEVKATAAGAEELHKVKSALEEEKRISAKAASSLEEASQEVATLKACSSLNCSPHYKRSGLKICVARITEEESIRISVKAEAAAAAKRYRDSCKQSLSRCLGDPGRLR
eukprot:Skav224554  [mRNA]  locus=scaffold2085:79720:88215:+ [translate_table: standard]